MGKTLLLFMWLVEEKEQLRRENKMVREDTNQGLAENPMLAAVFRRLLHRFNPLYTGLNNQYVYHEIEHG